MRVKRYWLTAMLFAAMILIAGCSKSDKGKDKDKETADDRTTVNNITAPAQPMKADVGKAGIAFSRMDYFYSEDLEVELLVNKPGKIYYTLDGKEPDQTQTLYKEAIKLTSGVDTKATSIKAKAFFDDGTESETIVHTYFVGRNVKSRFDTLVFSVTTDPYNLYDYDYGIFVEGKLRDEYIKEHPNEKINPDAPANYNIRGINGEREVYLEILEPDGNRVVGQEAGIRTYGGWSRARAQKSIKIFARKDYDPDNSSLKYEFFPDRLSSKGKVIDTYKQLVLRNCGNDNGFAFMRDELFQTLAGQAGYQDYEAVRPAALFVNGDYRGFFWLHDVYGNEYFEDHYGKYPGDFEVLEGGEDYKNPSDDGDNSRVIEDYNNMYAYSQTDLTDDINYNKLCEQLDVENYLSYYALQLFIGNEDWPQNNYKTYRYYAAEGEEYGEAPFDGKWRYLLHDLDFSFGIYGSEPTTDNIEDYMAKSPLFTQLMKRKDCQEIFVKKTLDLMNGAFSAGNLEKVMNDMNNARLNELKNTYGKDLLEDWVSFDQLPGRLEEVKSFAIQRVDYLLTKYQTYFNLGDTYTITVQPADGCQVKINSYITDQSFTGNYYVDYNMTINPLLPKGKKFGYWTVNGKKVETKELTITPAMLSDRQAEITLTVK